MNDEHDQVMTTARRAWNGFVAGRATGDWRLFLETLSDDVTFYVPSSGPFQGENHGKRRAEDFTHHMSADPAKRLSFEEPVRVSREGATVVFEAWDEGTIAGKPITNRIALSFDIDGDRVMTVREYVGVMD